LLFTTGEGSIALALIGMGLADCDHVLVVTLLIIGYGINGLTAAGIAVLTLDMAPQYAGKILLFYANEHYLMNKIKDLEDSWAGFP
jgi:hypothetical protein